MWDLISLVSPSLCDLEFFFSWNFVFSICVAIGAVVAFVIDILCVKEAERYKSVIT